MEQAANVAVLDEFTSRNDNHVSAPSSQHYPSRRLSPLPPASTTRVVGCPRSPLPPKAIGRGAGGEGP